MLHVTDHLGSVAAVVRGSDGALYEASEYDAYGKRSSLTSAGTVPVPVVFHRVCPEPDP